MFDSFSQFGENFIWFECQQKIRMLVFRFSLVQVIGVNILVMHANLDFRFGSAGSSSGP